MLSAPASVPTLRVSLGYALQQRSVPVTRWKGLRDTRAFLPLTMACGGFRTVLRQGCKSEHCEWPFYPVPCDRRLPVRPASGVRV